MLASVLRSAELVQLAESIESQFGHRFFGGITVTLDGCFYKKFNLPEGIGNKSIVHVHMALLGYDYMDGEDVLFDSLTSRTLVVNKNRPDLNP